MRGAGPMRLDLTDLNNSRNFDTFMTDCQRASIGRMVPTSALISSKGAERNAAPVR
jgi:hypothetical protein